MHVWTRFMCDVRARTRERCACVALAGPACVNPSMHWHASRWSRSARSMVASHWLPDLAARRSARTWPACGARLLNAGRCLRCAAATGAGSAVLLGASWRPSPALNAEAIHRVEWTTEQVRDLLNEYQKARTLQNYCAALGIVGLGLLDLAMLTSTGVFGLLVGAGGVVVYVYDNLRPVNGDESGRVRFIDVSEPHEELIGIIVQQSLLCLVCHVCLAHNSMNFRSCVSAQWT